MSTQIEVEVTEERDNRVELQCRAAKDTWSHQRRKRRILERVKRELEQRRSTVRTEAGACMHHFANAVIDITAAHASEMAPMHVLVIACVLMWTLREDPEVHISTIYKSYSCI